MKFAQLILNKFPASQAAILLLLIVNLFPLRAFGQTRSNSGTEFWVAFPTHAEDNDRNGNPLYANMSLFITGGANSSGMITAGSFSQSFQVNANGVTEVLVPRSAAYISEEESGRVLANRAIHITVDQGKPRVALYAHIYAGNRSAASLILPQETLGQQYYSMNYAQHDTEGKNFITVVATEPQTRIHLKKGNKELVTGGILLNNVNDVYEYLSPDDLTGVSVSVDTLSSACKHFAVFSGSSGVYISRQDCTPSSLDPLFQQLSPVPSWGKNYGYIPFSKTSPFFTDSVRTAGQYIRVLAAKNGTLVNLGGVPVASLNAGEFYTTPKPLEQAAGISANNPISVAQYALTQSCSNLGAAKGYSDPDMVILNPVNYSISDITVFSSRRENIKEQYLNVLIRTSAAGSFRINGNIPAAPFLPVGTLPGFSAMQLNLNKDSTNTYHLQASDGFNATAYGFGNVESYAYSAGTNLNASQAISGLRTATNELIDSACLNDAYEFKLTLPYQSPRISWQMDGNETPAIVNNPVAVRVLTDGIETFEYHYPQTPAYTIPGIHQIKILADPSDAIAGCSNTAQEIDYKFKVIPLPGVAFEKLPADCAGNLEFRNKTVSPGRAISSWSWDFGDPASGAANSSSLKDPSHLFSKAGRYTITLTATAANGCASGFTDTLFISKKKPKISSTPGGCTGTSLLFIDTAKYEGFIPFKRTWFFGDGDSVKLTGNATAVHQYQRPGAYQIRVSTVSQEGCSSDTGFSSLTIYAKPAADFTMPGICLTDAVAQFKNVSVGGVSYNWDFGDTHATTSNLNFSAEENPAHQYSAAGTYRVTLKVTSEQGCDSTVTKNFTVNGVLPKAVFKLASQHICSGAPLLLTNNSKVLDFGKVIRLEIYYDAVNHPEDKITIDSPRSDTIYMHLYPSLLQGSDSIKYRVKVVAFSGTACADTAEQEITVLPLPKTALVNFDPVCLSSKPFQLYQGSELSGIKGGQGFYSGNGVSWDGKFDPAAAGVGSHKIIFTYVSPAGCADTVSRQLVVLEAPLIGAKDEYTIIQGGSIKLDANASGTNLSFSWSPATWLSNSRESSPLANPVETTSYTITVSNGACETEKKIKVNVLKPIRIFNTFTPNGDGINDLWEIPELLNYPGAIVDIFDRYGQMVFHSAGYARPWDGFYKGRKLPVGTYYYLVDPKNGLKPLAGFVALLR
ncbi:gliding motility-associated C-terminal domain-containing protein [Mucilaginibacter sp. BJC16-A38]|uniref:PKD domain-containing protein n=1 Tax=Mucilaginibacter phenanthrenivorans TaxID=1234842 RepID=UPI0021570CA6|nr:PKD domain-containing protein [Mucilaginibacter phenanthrenivorans]MCR8558156.1 gliding motility-associated C-terminal domain-containing protein [Mucilaginibacter phenanthrenivorans]